MFLFRMFSLESLIPHNFKYLTASTFFDKLTSLQYCDGSHDWKKSLEEGDA